MFGNKESAVPQGATTLIAPGGARVRVLNGGLLEGEIWVGDVIVNGHVRGNIHASNLVKLASKAVIEGNIHYSLIEVEKGAEVMGNFVLEQSINNVCAFPKDNSAADG
jgi:cytoskeletal protein CcmA (bactofilin family)